METLYKGFRRLIEAMSPKKQLHFVEVIALVSLLFTAILQFYIHTLETSSIYGALYCFPIVSGQSCQIILHRPIPSWGLCRAHSHLPQSVPIAASP